MPVSIMYLFLFSVHLLTLYCYYYYYYWRCCCCWFYLNCKRLDHIVTLIIKLGWLNTRKCIAYGSASVSLIYTHTDTLTSTHIYTRTYIHSTHNTQIYLFNMRNAYTTLNNHSSNFRSFTCKMMWHASIKYNLLFLHINITQ